MKRLMLWLGVLAPLLYYGAVIGGALSWPAYSHVTQYASELGSAAAPHPEYFNWPIMAAGGLAVLSSLGFFAALRERGAGVVAAFLTALSIALWGVSMVMGGSFPMPNPLHNGFGLGLAIQLAPLFMLWALWGAKAPGLKLFLAVVFVASLGLLLVMFNVGDLNLVRQSNVGLWQRAYSLSSIPWLAVAALALMGPARKA
ncbi:MAG: DUF998 domain-containing protein [Thiobacillus sp.]|nr:DUF998 domain-containing protein [Thiobacillus sp.]